MRSKTKVWLGLSSAVFGGAGLALNPGGAAAFSGDGAVSAPSAIHWAGGEAGHAQHGAATMTAGAGGEGGEGGGEKGAAAPAESQIDPAVRFFRDIALIRGHLTVGDELVQAGRWDDALPHYLHPSVEIYGGIKGDLKTYKVRPFESALKALAQTVKAKKKEAYGPALALVREQLAGAEAAVKSTRTDWPGFVVAVALETLKSATDEYGEAVSNGAIAEAVEYQDSRGFVWEAERLVQSVAPDLKAKDADGFAAMQADFTALKEAWPTPVPPARAVKDTSDVLSGVARIELHAGGMM
jgi:hypothetical protein